MASVALAFPILFTESRLANQTSLRELQIMPCMKLCTVLFIRLTTKLSFVHQIDHEVVRKMVFTVAHKFLYKAVHKIVYDVVYKVEHDVIYEVVND